MISFPVKKKNVSPLVPSVLKLSITQSAANLNTEVNKMQETNSFDKFDKAWKIYTPQMNPLVLG